MTQQELQSFVIWFYHGTCKLWDSLKSVRLWIHGLIVAIITGAASGLSTMTLLPEEFQFSHLTLKKMVLLAISGAWPAVLLYFRTPPKLDK